MAVFDALAQTYDDEFTSNPIAQVLRRKVHDRLLSHFKTGDHILEIGCGTGEDALFLAQQGIHVIATDVSEKMLTITREKNVNNSLVTTKQLDLNHLPDDFQGTYDGVLSNFGVLNCATDLRELADWLAQRTKSGAVIGFAIMSPYCAWEFVWHALHWEWDIALRRLHGSTFQPEGTHKEIKIDYPTVRRITQAFSEHFERITVKPLGLLLPPSGLFDVIQKRPRLMKVATRFENAIENINALAMFADHYWIEFKRK